MCLYWVKRCIGCLRMIGHFPPKSTTINSSFAEREVECEACVHLGHLVLHRYKLAKMYVYIYIHIHIYACVHRGTKINTGIYMYIYVYTYIFANFFRCNTRLLKIIRLFCKRALQKRRIFYKSQLVSVRYEAPSNYTSLLQKSPTKKTFILQKPTCMAPTYMSHICEWVIHIHVFVSALMYV